MGNLNKFCVIERDVVLGADVVIANFVNLFGCSIGDRTKIGSFVEVQRYVQIGADCSIGKGSFICTGVFIEDKVFIGPETTFTNDKFPRTFDSNGKRRTIEDLGAVDVYRTVVKSGASIGAGSIILPGVNIGKNAIIGAGSIVTKDVQSDCVYAGAPARLIRSL